MRLLANVQSTVCKYFKLDVLLRHASLQIYEISLTAVFYQQITILEFQKDVVEMFAK